MKMEKIIIFKHENKFSFFNFIGGKERSCHPCQKGKSKKTGRLFLNG
jgi:hypothetical protein